MKKSVLKDYASLIVRVGLNVQPGQEVVITASTEIVDFTLMCVEECYKCGAEKVRVDWINQDYDRIEYKYRSLESLKTLDKWELEKAKHSADKLVCRLYLESEDPDGLIGVDLKKMGEAVQARRKRVKVYRDKMDGKCQWCIAAVPGVKWAKKLFPTLSKRAAVEKLWEKILLSSRALENPVEQWKEHDEDLKKRCAYLNSLDIDSLHYTSDEGTNFTVGLMNKSLFLGGGEETIGERKVYFQPNIPSEECFTTPKKGRAEGKVVATMPLCYNGNLIENFSITFKDGKAVEWKAQKNEELLTSLLTMDEGASYIGECALVPYSSPIRESGILFYSTLFDENAACHIAFGEGFDSALSGYEKMSKEECREKGVNDSIIHIDFMIGSPTLNIDATTRDGKKVAVFRNGEWAF